MRVILISFLIIGALGAAGYVFRAEIFAFLFRPLPTDVPAGLTEQDLKEQEHLLVIAEGLEVPWEIAFLPGGEILVTERPGRLRVLGEEEVTLHVQSVSHTGEGGLLGAALHPNFEENRWLYLYLTSREGGTAQNRVERYVFDGTSLRERKVIVEGIPGHSFHNGGRIRFGPDRMLYITTGDAGSPNLSQDIHSRAGKILRVHEDGSVPSDNPFGNAVWSFGHRNPQGLAWDDKGRLWATEHGPSARDEVNLIVRGGNYGWPEIRGSEEREGMRSPVLHSSEETWAPSGADILGNSLFFGGLRGNALFEMALEEGSLRAHFLREFGRVRLAKAGPDGFLYIATNNRDGRGTPAPEDDRIIRILPESLQ